MRGGGEPRREVPSGGSKEGSTRGDSVKKQWHDRRDGGKRGTFKETVHLRQTGGGKGRSARVYKSLLNYRPAVKCA